MTAIRDFYRKEHRTGIDYASVRRALKCLGLQKHYNHTVYIMKELRGRPLVTLSMAQEQKLLCRFLELKEVFECISDRRVNMLSYPYVIRKLCELEGWNRMAKIVPILKSFQRITSQDELWHEICNRKHWRFTPTPLH
jgi:hypothetical protein